MSSMISAFGPLRMRGSFCLLVAVSGSAYAADDRRFYDLMASVSMMQTPHVTEDSKAPGGATTSYEWKGMRDSGAQAAVTLLTGTLSHSRTWGFEWGGDVVVARYDITPSGYEVDGVSYVNTSSHDLTYSTAGANLAFGCQYGISEREGLHGFIEFVPFVGAGISHATTDITIGGSDTEASDYGYYLQYGARIGAYVTERRWIAGVVGSFQGGTGSVSIDGSGGYSSELTFEQTAFGFGGVLGYRF